MPSTPRPLRLCGESCFEAYTPLAMSFVEEHHQNEQYFFDEETLSTLADFVETFNRACCLCAPMLGRELHRRGRTGGSTIPCLPAPLADLPRITGGEKRGRTCGSAPTDVGKQKSGRTTL